jgi:hypothetical protein
MHGLASLPILSVLAGTLAVAFLSRPPDKSTAAVDARPLLPRPEFLHIVGAAEQQMVADYYWVMMTEATGAANSAASYRNLYDYADLITELDPNFRYVYVFAGVAIPHNEGRERWRNTEESTRMLQKGYALFPNYVYLRILLAYNLSYFHGRYEEAANMIRDTAPMPGAPAYLGQLATRLYATAGNVDAGLRLAMSLYQSATDPDSRAAFERRSKELLLERELQRIDKGIALFRKREGRPPAGIGELLTGGDIVSIPPDPLGGEIVIGNDGRSHSTAAEDQRLEVFDPRKKLDK